MILTGKTKDNFLNYYWSNHIEPLPMSICKRSDLEGFFNTIQELMQNALIIEFFDSVGITVDVMPVSNNPIKWMPNPFWIEKEISTDDAEYYETRPEATIEAIKKANEIYNAN